jgi:hypothetical protein|nr:hypothetical protein [Oxalobacteraceae bacterium]
MIELAKVPTGMSLVLAITVICLLGILWNFHRDTDNRVDLKDLICHQGQISEAKFARLGAFLVSTWGFVYLILDERFSEWYFAGYMAAWCGNALVNKYLNTKETAGPPAP